jgi:hypothetical protein
LPEAAPLLSSIKYVGQINFEDDEFETATATTVKEAKKLLEAGFQKADEFNASTSTASRKGSNVNAQTLKAK